MPPNTRINLIKRSHQTRKNSYFEKEEQDCKDGSGLLLINFLERMSRNVLVDISLLLPLLAFFLSYYKTIKRKYSKLQAIPIKYGISGMTVSL